MRSTATSRPIACLKLLLQRVDLIVGKRMRRGHLGGDFAAVARGERPERADDRGELGEAAILGEHAEELGGESSTSMASAAAATALAASRA